MLRIANEKHAIYKVTNYKQFSIRVPYYIITLGLEGGVAGYLY